MQEVNTKNWSSTDNQLLSRIYKDYTTSELAILFNRTYNSVKSNLQTLKLTKKSVAQSFELVPPPVTGQFTESEVDIIKRLYGRETYKTIGMLLNRKVSSIKTKVHGLGIQHQKNRYSVEDVKLLTKLYTSGYTLEYISEKLGRPQGCLQYKAHLLKIKRGSTVCKGRCYDK